MRVAVTGTPGTGKTTATDRLSTSLDVVHLNEVIKREELTTGRDEERDTLVTDVEAVAEWLDGREDVLFESHLAHHFDADRVVVLRAHPETIEDRLAERGESQRSVAENAESEALDVILAEAVDRHGEERVYEIETTDLTPDETAAAIQSVIDGERDPSAGEVSYVDYL
ncbi:MULTISPECIES: adenylate kinase family protein [Salinibaculum]|uniref:adenylate kinase family protein n=1 Tax=Salinibaculum TaxID=2732368 RepID=UPI0030D0DDAC